MPRIDLLEPWAIRQKRQWIKDSMMSHGEEAILIHMFHVNDVGDTVDRCPSCYDGLYKGGDRFDCSRCYGSTYDGGVKDIWRAWAMFTDAKDEEDFTKTGLWNPVAREMQTEHIPDLWQRDYVVRVDEWDRDHRVKSIEGIYVLKDVANDTLRTGAWPAQTVDNVAQRASISRISKDMPIRKYGFVGKIFNRYDGRVR